MKRTWKMGLPMYLISDELKRDYELFQYHVMETLYQYGLTDEIKLTSQFPASLNKWWLDPEVILTQTCGYPLTHALRDRVNVLATPCYSFKGCEGPRYRSAFICHRKQSWRHLLDSYGSRVVINQSDSNSGMNVLRAAIAEYQMPRFFQSVCYSGSHLSSLHFIQNQLADLAAIDCISLEYALHFYPETYNDIRILGYSQATFALPYICAQTVPNSIQALVLTALQHVSLQNPVLMQRLGIQGIVPSDLNDYDPILQLEHSASELGYSMIQ